MMNPVRAIALDALARGRSFGVTVLRPERVIALPVANDDGRHVGPHSAMIGRPRVVAIVQAAKGTA